MLGCSNLCGMCGQDKTWDDAFYTTAKNPAPLTSHAGSKGTVSGYNVKAETKQRQRDLDSLTNTPQGHESGWKHVWCHWLYWWLGTVHVQGALSAASAYIQLHSGSDIIRDILAWVYKILFWVAQRLKQDGLCFVCLLWVPQLYGSATGNFWPWKKSVSWRCWHTVWEWKAVSICSEFYLEKLHSSVFALTPFLTPLF